MITLLEQHTMLVCNSVNGIDLQFEAVSRSQYKWYYTVKDTFMFKLNVDCFI